MADDMHSLSKNEQTSITDLSLTLKQMSELFDVALNARSSPTFPVTDETAKKMVAAKRFIDSNLLPVLEDGMQEKLNAFANKANFDERHGNKAYQESLKHLHRREEYEYVPQPPIEVTPEPREHRGKLSTRLALAAGIGLGVGGTKVYDQITAPAKDDGHEIKLDEKHNRPEIKVDASSVAPNAPERNTQR